MMETAKYVLENQDAERIDLTAPGDIFMVNVEGLGATSNQSFISLLDGFFRVISDEQPQNGITGDLIYRDGAYRNYQMLVDWLMRATRLIFCYTPQETEYRKEVRLNFIQKDRRDSAGWMRAGISFYPLTPWYTAEATPIKIIASSDDDKQYGEYTEGGSTLYGYQYSAALKYGAASIGGMSAVLTIAGHDPAGFVLRYSGAVTNPVIVVSSGGEIGRCVITQSFSSGDVLELSTKLDDCHVWKISGGTVTDLIQANAVNLQYDVFPRITPYESTTLTISGNAELTGTAELTVYPVWRSV